MSKKMKILLAVVAAVVVLTVGGGVVVMANGGDEPAQSATHNNPLLVKVAAMLDGVTEQELVDAFAQAREQTVRETIVDWLAKALENGTITTDEKAAIETWLAEKPDGTDKDAMKAWYEQMPKVAKTKFMNSLLRAPLKARLFMPVIASDAVLEKVADILDIDAETLKGAFQEAGKQLKSDVFTKALDKAVENGKITQGEADEIETWWGQRPEAVDKLMPDAGAGILGRVRGGVMKFRCRLPGIRAQ